MVSKFTGSIVTKVRGQWEHRSVWVRAKAESQGEKLGPFLTGIFSEPFFLGPQGPTPGSEEEA